MLGFNGLVRDNLSAAGDPLVDLPVATNGPGSCDLGIEQRAAWLVLRRIARRTSWRYFCPSWVLP
jgi:hypothetical protein